MLRITNGLIDSVTSSESPRLVLDSVEIPLPSGAVILPGLVDTHCHLMGMGEMADRVQLHGASSAAECVARIARRVAEAPAGEWILGFGYNEEEWADPTLPSRALLDNASSHNPVALFRIDTHAAWLNTRALAEAGIEPGAIHGGEVKVGEDGAPTGILIDEAVNMMRRRLPRPSVAIQRRWMEYAVGECLRFGITEVHDMNVEPERLEALAVAAELGEMRIRCRLFLQAQNDEWRVFPKPGPIERNVDVVGVKYFYDGALGSRGALLLEPYSDAPGTRGLELMTAEELVERASPAADAGYAIATHAIGDAANRRVLDAYATLRARHPDALLRIEHSQIVHPDDVPRFAELGVIAAMQATHCTSDASMAGHRLGPDRCSYAYGWRALRDLGVPIIGGSDFPVESADPLSGLRAFHFREPRPGSGAWYPGQTISRRDALDAYTATAPLGVPGEIRRGRLEAGLDADVTVLSGDPFDDHDARVLFTIVAGKIEYEG